MLGIIGQIGTAAILGLLAYGVLMLFISKIDRKMYENIIGSTYMRIALVVIIVYKIAQALPAG